MGLRSHCCVVLKVIKLVSEFLWGGHLETTGNNAHQTINDFNFLHCALNSSSYLDAVLWLIKPDLHYVDAVSLASRCLLSNRVHQKFIDGPFLLICSP